MNNLTIKNFSRSLVDLINPSYFDSVCHARAYFTGVDRFTFTSLAEKRVEFYPEAFARRLDALISDIGKQVCPPFTNTFSGAGVNSFIKATHTQSSPLSGFGFYRIGEDGRLYVVSKSEHYHASLGHSFPGYQLIEHAKQLGIPNATHNNTRGSITRVLEEELIRICNGIDTQDRDRLTSTIASKEAHILNRVINLETGSLAVEAGLKMMLARFYRLDDTYSQPKYSNRIPVFLVIADHQGGKKANYHGTTIFTQFLRGMWPDLYDSLAQNKNVIVQPVNINDIQHFKSLVDQYNQAPYKIAGFFHEIVLMNYGGILLEKDFLQEAYKICHNHDIPVMVDEIQSCIWSPEYFLFREYGLNPDFVSIGKGFPGGEYPASRIVTTAEMDSLNQFGALVTNGQEELASLAYLITMEFVKVNGDYIAGLGDYYHYALVKLAERYPKIITKIEGYRHLSSIFFDDVEKTTRFIRDLNLAGLDISAQTYKANCPPVALTKIPLTSSVKMVDFMIEKMDSSLKKMAD